MTDDISRQKQSIFQPVESEIERQDILANVAKVGGLLHIKSEAKSGPDTVLTALKATIARSNSIRGKHFSGPGVPIKETVTVLIELNATKYFTKGTVKDHVGDEYSVEIGKIFKLQRRNTFRVSIPKGIVAAHFVVSRIGDDFRNEEIRIVDLSIGGVGLVLSTSLKNFIKREMNIEGVLRVAKHPILPMKAVVRFIRPGKADGEEYTHAGCEFLENTAAIGEKISFLVNDCHRLIFIRKFV